MRRASKTVHHAFLRHEGVLAALIRDFDWSKTALMTIFRYGSPSSRTDRKASTEQRVGATTVAQTTITESVANHGITEPELVSMFAVAIALALHESDAPGDQRS
jgi:hypothetical protein